MSHRTFKNWEKAKEKRFNEIAVILNKKFPKLIDVLDLDDAKLIEMMTEAGLIDRLPEDDDTLSAESAEERECRLHSIKCALLRVIENDGDYNARQNEGRI